MALSQLEELIQTAVRHEEVGIAFYKGLAQAAITPVVRATFEAMSREEEYHATRFAQMLPAVKATEGSIQFSRDDEEYARALAETVAFQEPQQAGEAARGATTDKDVIATALRMEKDALLYYQDLEPFLPEEEGEALKTIMGEERGHLRTLFNLKASLEQTAS